MQKLKNFEAWQKQWITFANLLITFYKIKCIKYSGETIWREMQRINEAATRLQRWIKRVWRTRLHPGETIDDKLKEL